MSEHRSPSGTVGTAQRWYQTKRLPLYAVVAGTVGVAAYYLTTNKTQQPGVEANRALRKSDLPEERSGAASEGAQAHDSAGRQLTKGLGMVEGNKTDGIFPNEKIAAKLGEVKDKVTGK